MFARSVSVRLKPNGIAEFSRVIEASTIPLLRKHQGFQDEITFFVPGGSEAVEISLWDRKEDADAYGRRGAPKLMKALENQKETMVRNLEMKNLNATISVSTIGENEGDQQRQFQRGRHEQHRENWGARGKQPSAPYFEAVL